MFGTFTGDSHLLNRNQSMTKSIQNMKYSIANELRQNPLLLPEQVIRNSAGTWKRLDCGCLHPSDYDKINSYKILFVLDFNEELEKVVALMPLLFQDMPCVKIFKELNK